MRPPLIQPGTRCALATVGLLAGMLCAGCHRPLNDSNELYGTTPLSGLDATMPRDSVAQPDAEAQAGSSIAPLDRSGFEPIVIEVQTAQVESPPLIGAVIGRKRFHDAKATMLAR